MPEKQTAKKGGKKNRKFDRHEKRSPAAARYRGESRWLVNKEKRQRKEAMRRAAKRDPRVPRGTARAKRRVHLQRPAPPNSP